MQTITIKQVRDLSASGHVVFGYPRKCEVVVDGFKRYVASAVVAKEALALCRAANNKTV